MRASECPWLSMLIQTCAEQMTENRVQKIAENSHACERRRGMEPV
jgi:hypothetical protein